VGQKPGDALDAPPGMICLISYNVACDPIHDNYFIISLDYTVEIGYLILFFRKQENLGQRVTHGA